MIFKLIFHRNYRFHLFDQGRHRTIHSCWEVFDGTIVDLCSLHPYLDSPKFPGSATFFLFRPIFISHYKFEFVHHELSLKNNYSNWVLRWRTVDFVRCIRFLLVQISQKSLSIVFLDIQTYPPLSPIILGLISIEVSMKNFLVKTFLIVMLSLLFLAVEYWPFDFPNNAIYIVHLDIETPNSL